MAARSLKEGKSYKGTKSVRMLKVFLQGYFPLCATKMADKVVWMTVTRRYDATSSGNMQLI